MGIRRTTTMDFQITCRQCGRALDVGTGASGSSPIFECANCSSGFSDSSKANGSKFTTADLDRAASMVNMLAAEGFSIHRDRVRRRRDLRVKQTQRFTLNKVLQRRQALDETVGRLGGFLIIITVGGGGLFVVLHALGLVSSTLSYCLAVAAGMILAGVAYALVVVFPEDSTLAKSIAGLDAAIQIASEHYDRVARDDEFQRQRYEAAESAFEDLQASINSTIYRLQNSLWQQMTGGPFENFLAEVFEHCGYAVELTGRTGDQGVDLVVSREGKCVAVQAKGYIGHSVGNEAVQQAFTGMAHRRCHGAAVITNSRFTGAARELADSVGCTLIDGTQIPELIEGRIVL